MRRKMLGALLLPLPFAALPIAAVLFSSAPATSNDGLVVQTPMPLEQPREAVASASMPDVATADETLAYGVGSRSEIACDDLQPASEG